MDFNFFLCDYYVLYIEYSYLDNFWRYLVVYVLI